MRLKFLFFILSSLIFLNVGSCQNFNDGFIATFPTSVLPDTVAQFCIRLLNVNEDVLLKINDQDKPECFEPIEKKISPQDGETCLDINIFKLNDIDENKRKSIQVVVSTLNGQTKFKDMRYFEYKASNSFTLVETDKAVYKPGQKVLIRILSLDYQVKIVERTYAEIYIEDPSESRIMQWTDVKTKRGLIELEMPLSDEPNLGSWSIKVQENNNNKNSKLSTSFEVKKYVLPKFEVTLDHYQTISIEDKTLNVSVCAKYSYSKNVQGTFEIHAFTKTYSYEDYEMKLFKSLKKNSIGKGCESFEISLDELGIPGPQYITEIKLEASVKEADTNLEMTSNSDVSVSFHAIKIEKLEPEYYKPGFPINFKILLKSVKGEKIRDEKCQITLKKNYQTFYERNFVSDENGLIKFEFDPSRDCSKEICTSSTFDKPSTISVTVVRSNKVDVVHSTQIPYWAMPHDSKGYFSIPVWFTKKNSYIQLFPEKNKEGKLNSGDLASFDAKIRATKNMANEKLYFQVQSRSDVQLAGHFDFKSQKTVLNSNLNQLNVNIEQIESNVEKIKYEPTKTLIEICGLEADVGNGNDTFMMWYYDSASNECSYFMYTGSGGNNNKFPHKETCESQCKTASYFYNIAGETVSSSVADKANLYSYTLNLKFEVNEEMSPSAKILVFFIQDDEIIPDNAEILVSKQLKHKVDLSLKSSNVKVGSYAEIKINSEPNSLCALSGVDKSVTFMAQRNTIDLESIFDKLNKFELEYDNNNNYPSTESKCRKHHYNDFSSQRSKRFYRPHLYHKQFYDAAKSFKKSRVVYLSNFKIYEECFTFYPVYYEIMPRVGPVAMARMGTSTTTFKISALTMTTDQEYEQESTTTSTNQKSVTIRTFFPETWLWSILESDSNGLINKSEKVPDTITDWNLDAYCLSSVNGLGVAEPQTLKVFQSVFVSLDMPYSVVKGEVFPIKASAFNYEDTCIPIKMEISPDNKIYMAKNAPRMVTKCVCADEKVTHEFLLQAFAFDVENGLKISVKVSNMPNSSVCTNENKKVTKRVSFYDTETRSLIVEPEGIPKEEVKSSFVILKANEPKSYQRFEILSQANVVPKTSRAYLLLTGDAMGNVLSNLDNLVQQPTGCGEQNMVKFAPIISVLKYLKETNQLTTKMSDLTNNYLNIGYQHQLKYRHPDGSFSAFGPNNYNKETGGTWLTAFVVRCFADAFNHIQIDKRDILSSSEELLNRQDEDGSFKQTGAQLFSKALAGGLKDQKTGLSSYVMVSLLKARNALGLSDMLDHGLEKGFEYLELSLENVDSVDTYTLALSLYALKLDNNRNTELIQKIENELNKRAVDKDGMMYWREKNETEPKSKDRGMFYSLSQSADLEITSYVLLTKLYDFDSKKNDLSQLVKIAKWINSQRNSLGGFYSTQDTVLALDALSNFAQKFYSPKVNVKVSCDFNGQKVNLAVNHRNRLLNQKIKLENFKEKEMNTMECIVDGEGSALIQLIAKYNNKQAKEENGKISEFDFGIISSKSLIGSPCSFSQLTINARYTGEKEKSEMVIISLRLPSGWVAIENDFETMLNKGEIQRYELNEGKVFIYLDYLTQEGHVFKFNVEKKFEIQNRKPGIISVYDYYQPIDEAVTSQFDIKEEKNVAKC